MVRTTVPCSVDRKPPILNWLIKATGLLLVTVPDCTTASVYCSQLPVSAR